jgi:hypothetical protein
MIEFVNAITEFDQEHTTKQIILIGVDGAVRNIEFKIEEGDENDE